MSSNGIKEKQTEEQFTNTLSSLKTDEKPKYKEEKTSAGKALSLYSVKVTNLPKKADNTTEGTFKLALVNQDNKWVVDSVNVQ